MTPTEFQTLMGELADYYGKRYMPAQQDIIWRILRPLSKSQGKVVCDAVVLKHQRQPTPAAFKAEAIPLSVQANQTQKQDRIKSLPPCSVCAGSGQMVALLRSNPIYEFAFACPYCSAADVLGFRALPVWSEACEAKYVKVSLRHDSLIAADQLRQKAFEKLHRRKDGEDVSKMRAVAPGDGVLPEGRNPSKPSGPVQDVREIALSRLLPCQPGEDARPATGVPAPLSRDGDEAWPVEASAGADSRDAGSAPARDEAKDAFSEVRDNHEHGVEDLPW